jgi:hypothetical protein
VWLSIFLMVEWALSFQSGSLMGQQEKLTKQGVRDLNHLAPKRPTALKVEPLLAEDARIVSPATVVPEGIVTSPIET